MGDSGLVFTSANCTTWTIRTSATKHTLRGVAHKWFTSPNLFVAVGDHGTILTSSDGISWVSQSSGTQANLFAVTYNPMGRYFIATGDSGTIITSSNGVAWSHQSSPSKRCLRCVSNYGYNGNIVAGDSGIIMTSPDTTNWIIQASGTTNDLHAVYCLVDLRVGQMAVDTSIPQFYDGRYYVATGKHGTIVSSPDGKVWSKTFSGTQQNLNGISGKYNQFIVVGDHGTILTSTVRYVSVSKEKKDNVCRDFVIHGSTVSFFLSVSQKASLQICNLSGRLVKTLLIRDLGNGMHTARIPSGLIPGSYVLLLRTNAVKFEKTILISGWK